MKVVAHSNVVTSIAGHNAANQNLSGVAGWDLTAAWVATLNFTVVGSVDDFDEVVIQVGEDTSDLLRVRLRMDVIFSGPDITVQYAGGDITGYAVAAITPGDYEIVFSHDGMSNYSLTYNGSLLWTGFVGTPTPTVACIKIGGDQSVGEPWHITRVRVAQ
jgi:hypothetical protein